MEHTFQVTVRSTEVDTIGHLNNAKYLEYMEWARFDWLKQRGITLEYCRQNQFLPAIVNININYRKELLMDDVVTIKSTSLSHTQKTIVVSQELYNQKGERAADAQFTMVMIDAKERRAIPLPEIFMQYFPPTS